MSRMKMPDRRRSYTIDFTHWVDGGTQPLTATYSVDDQGTLFEVFIDGPKTNSMSRLAKDTGMLISFSLQHGVSLDLIRAALGRDDETGRPHSIAGSAIDVVHKHYTNLRSKS